METLHRQQLIWRSEYLIIFTGVFFPKYNHPLVGGNKKMIFWENTKKKTGAKVLRKGEKEVKERKKC